jgi:putative DNA primase/helicase
MTYASTPIATFDIRNFLDRLEPAKEKGKYICPACEGHNLSIVLDTGEYTCYNHCERRDIREALKPWAEVVAERAGSNYTPSPNRKPGKAKTVKLNPAPIPDDSSLAMLTQPATDIPQPQKLRSKRKGIPGNAIEITYLYSESQWIDRYEWPDISKEKGYDKSFRQWHRLPDGTPEMKKGDKPWGAYRIDEAIAAAKSVAGTPALLQHEGEGCVEVGRANGLAGFTFQGSAWDKKTIMPEYQRAKEEGIGLIVFLHDADDTGLKKLQTCQDCAAEVGIALIGINPHDICPDLPYKSSDIKEILAQMETPEFIRRLEQEIHAAVAERHLQAEVNTTNPDDTLNDLDPVVSFIQIAFKTLYGDKSWICAADRLYWHTGNHYKHSPDSREIKRITDFCNSFAVENEQGKKSYPYASPSSVKKVLEWAKMRTGIEAELLNPPGVNCTNGIVKVEWEGRNFTVRLAPHTPEDYYIYEPLIEYNPNADDTYCEQLLACLDKPQQEIFLRNIAASLDLQTVRKFRGREVKAIFAIGLGSNGKDALRECVSTIYGKNGLTSVSLGDFQSYDEGRKFGLAPLIYSLVNWASENPQTSRIDRLQSLKLFVTGDTLHCEQKGKDHIEFSSNAIGIFNLNETPAFQGVIQAIKDRIAILEFKKTFVDNPDPNNPNEIKGDPRFRYDPDFIRTHVAPAFLNRMLKALNNLLESGIDYECTTDAFRNLQKENNHLFNFIEDEKLGYVEGGEMSVSALWMLLENWYQQNGTLTIDENNRRTWIDQVRPSDKNVKGINQVSARIAQLFPKAVMASRYCDVRKKQIPILKGIGILEVTRPSLESTRPIPAPLPAPETQSQQATRPTRPSFSNFGENNGEESDMKIELLSPTMEKEEYVPQSGAGGAEVLQDKENWGGNWGETGAGSSQSGAGMPTEDQAVKDATITSDTVLVKTEYEFSYSLLQIEIDGGDIAGFVGCQVEVRSLSGAVKFAGEMINYDSKNGIVTVATEQGNRDASLCETFVTGLWNILDERKS